MGSSTAGNSVKQTRPNSTATADSFSAHFPVEQQNLEEIPGMSFSYITIRFRRMAFKTRKSTHRTRLPKKRKQSRQKEARRGTIYIITPQFIDTVKRMKKDHLDTTRRYTQSETIITDLKGKIEVTAIRCQRAEKLAAYVEAQLKTLKPNTILDYKMVRDIEPSSQLVAAMLVKEPIKDPFQIKSQSEVEISVKRQTSVSKRRIR
jgi:hypothetical protein